MNKIRSTTFVLSMLMAFGLAATVKPVSAGVEAECRQEAEDYEVMPELRNDYINGCIESRGGASASGSIEQVDSQPSESVDSQLPESFDSQPPESFDWQPPESDDTSSPVTDSEKVAE